MKEEDIRPRQVFHEYLRLAALDAGLYFTKSERYAIPCPACLKPGKKVFEKHGFDYEVCPACQTLFVSPRPPIEDFFAYYQTSASAAYFATTFYKETAEARREKLWKPRARMVLDTLCRLGAEKYRVFDIGGGYGIFAEEFQALSGNPVTIIEPGPELARVCRGKGLQVIESFLETVTPELLPEGPRVFVSFELFEHLHDCRVFLQRLQQLMQPGDKFIFSTLSGMGVDIQTLWEDSNSMSLQHLNFFNPNSIRLLLKGLGLLPLSVETPGKLDLDIMQNQRDKVKDRFWRNLLAQVTSEDLQSWQEFIAARGCSSHMMVICESP